MGLAQERDGRLLARGPLQCARCLCANKGHEGICKGSFALRDNASLHGAVRDVIKGSQESEMAILEGIRKGIPAHCV